MRVKGLKRGIKAGVMVSVILSIRASIYRWIHVIFAHSLHFPKLAKWWWNGAWARIGPWNDRWKSKFEIQMLWRLIGLQGTCALLLEVGPMPNDIILFKPCAAYAFLIQNEWIWALGKGETKRNKFDVEHLFIWRLELGEIWGGSLEKFDISKIF
jgi:hypothetical protein